MAQPGQPQPGQPQPGQPQPGQPQPGQPQPGQPQPGQPEAGKPAAEPGKVVLRQDVVKSPADQQELAQAAVGEDGKVAFQFRNQAWPELIDWLAELSGQPLDWLELPADRVNITTPGRYTVAEVIDLFNRHLLGRGYTLLALDGGMTVVKCATINPAIVPRIDPDELSAIPPHSFVRTSFEAGWLSAEKLATEFKPMISENGKLTALTTTNRIEAMDAAITLQQIGQLLRRELDTTSRESLAPEFKLRHIPAEEAKTLLEQFLGLAGKKAAPLTPEQMQMQMQMRMQMQQGGKPPAPEPDKPEIAIVANNRQNSILIQASADRVAVATEFLKRIDVPGANLATLADVENRVQVFRLVSLDPAKLIEIVQEMNILEPATRIRVDSDNRALIVSASAADRFIIQQVITRLDGSGRSFEVLQLRRLDAAEVAESIGFLMGKNEEKKDSGRDRFPYFFGGQNDQKKKDEDQFRVAANTRYRQVLLWANESEMSEVRNLLVKLGELPPPDRSDRVFRVIEAESSQETLRYLQELQRQWQQVEPNPIELPPAEKFLPKAAPTPAPGTDLPAAPDIGDAVLNAVTPGAARAGDAPSTATLIAAKTNDQEPDTTEPADAAPQAAAEQPDIRSAEDFDRAFKPRPKPPATSDAQSVAAEPGAPIRIEVDSSGNLVLSSRDTAALDRLEELMLRFAPPRRSYHTFYAKHVSAVWITLNLEEFFEEEDQEDDSSGFPRWLFGLDDPKDKGPSGLGKSAKLRFVADIDTGTIVVSNATADQLTTIEELIKLWDVPEPVNDRRVRYTKLIPLRHGRAAMIAETIKETYRDLLSGNDKAFQQTPGGGGGGQPGAPPRTTGGARPGGGGRGSELVDAGGSGQQSGGADFSFKGKLSVGVDPVGNTILLSAEGEPLLKLVADMIDQLDQAARSADGVQITHMSTTISASALETALQTLRTASPTPSLSPPPQPPAAPPQERDNAPARPAKRPPAPSPSGE